MLKAESNKRSVRKGTEPGVEKCRQIVEYLLSKRKAEKERGDKNKKGGGVHVDHYLNECDKSILCA